jgi:hypothetical protein
MVAQRKLSAPSEASNIRSWACGPSQPASFDPPNIVVVEAYDAVHFQALDVKHKFRVYNSVYAPLVMQSARNAQAARAPAGPPKPRQGVARRGWPTAYPAGVRRGVAANH